MEVGAVFFVISGLRWHPQPAPCIGQFLTWLSLRISYLK